MPFCKKKKIIFIHIPKTGGSTMENFFDMRHEKIFFASDLLDMVNIKEVNFSPQHFNLQMLKEKNIIENISSYKKIVIVRNPYQRVISSFFWNTANKKFNPKKFHLFIVENYLDPKKDHFLPQSFYLEGVEFDYVARTETLDEDIEKINMLFNLKLEYDKKRMHVNKKSKKELLDKILPETYEIMNNIFIYDFEVLGYRKREF